ncbi:uncharacterized protein BDR25DRAFT_339922 [Lindgomyces ingoldianus]|uniref:Uncharacterized protein n=1 Tax=Lindgomyces ingoldianus TaxID=673940 RepID=A0ACB6R9P7_9PLEO|nr:uncharacterized protein BDR25DRAFT_339922 [Lindgomyces ingoldianus]KAF2476044.1 hypothetical protein BDR25DRAFT_339922 [Lindgomyces ingoldianus]
MKFLLSLIPFTAASTIPYGLASNYNADSYSQLRAKRGEVGECGDNRIIEDRRLVPDVENLDQDVAELEAIEITQRGKRDMEDCGKSCFMSEGELFVHISTRE